MGAPKWKTVAESPLSSVDYTKRKDVKVRTPDIEAELLEIHWHSGIDAARDKKKISSPHWTHSEDIQEEDVSPIRFKTGSTKPGVYLVAGKGKHELTVKVNVTKSNLPGEATLRGQLGTLSLSGSFQANVGEHAVTLKIEKPPTSCRHFEGDATWVLDAGSAGKKSLKSKTRLEVFFIQDKPAALFNQGVWVEALRVVFKKAGISGLSEPSDIAAAITKYCHTGHGMRYDTMHGASHFSTLNIGGSSFQLMKYLTRTGKKKNTVNCYDQAAAVQSLCGAVGVTLDWYFQQPYGFILTTNLVGIGPCNNPFFENDGSKPVVPSDSPNRTAFGNHAFVGLAKKIHDACAGPHAGTEDLRQYMIAAIDAKATISSLAPGFSPDQLFRELERRNDLSTGLQGIA